MHEMWQGRPCPVGLHNARLFLTIEESSDGSKRNATKEARDTATQEGDMFWATWR